MIAARTIGGHPSTGNISPLDNIALLASRICRAPIAFVRILGSDGKWREAGIGRDAASLSASSFYRHSLNRRNLFIVEDALLDSRFASDPLVISPPSIRFCAGTPLIANGKDVVGGILVMSPLPRSLDKDEEMALRILGQLVVAGREIRVTSAALQQTMEECKRKEEALRASEERIRLIIDNAYDAFVAINADGFIIDWNKEAETTFGWSREEAIGRQLAETIIPHQHRKAHLHGLRIFLASGHGPLLDKRFEITALHRDGREFPIELTVSTIRLGDAYIFSSFIHDISERKRADELRIAKEAAESASRAKSDFLSFISHEIRTPTNSMMGMAQALSQTPLNEEQQRYVEVMSRAGNTLSKLLNDLLDLSKAEAGHLKLQYVGFDLRDLIEGIEKLLEDRAREKGIHLKWNIEPSVPTQMIGDSDRLHQVVVNLVSNAIKFTDSGEVAIDIQCDPDLRERESVLFSISDTGPGIPADRVHTIFDRYTQVNPSPSDGQGGTGLGLSISKRLVEMMGGRIWVATMPGKGSVFSFSIPCCQKPTQTENQPRDVCTTSRNRRYWKSELIQ